MRGEYQAQQSILLHRAVDALEVQRSVCRRPAPRTLPCTWAAVLSGANRNSTSSAAGADNCLSKSARVVPGAVARTRRLWPAEWGFERSPSRPCASRERLAGHFGQFAPQTAPVRQIDLGLGGRRRRFGLGGFARLHAAVDFQLIARVRAGLMLAFDVVPSS